MASIRRVVAAMLAAAALLPVHATRVLAQGYEDPYSLVCKNYDPSKGLQFGQWVGPGRPEPVTLGPWKFEIPWCYFHPRPRRNLPCNPECAEIGIQFWIPSLDAPERDLWWRPENRPSETKRPTPRPDEFVIKVTSLRTLVNSGPEPIGANAGQSISNILRSHRGRMKIFEDRGLSRIESTEYPGTRGEWFERAPDHSLFISCSPPPEADSSTRCLGYLDLKDWQLRLTMILPGAAISQHGTIVSGVRTLLTRWRSH